MRSTVQPNLFRSIVIAFSLAASALCAEAGPYLSPPRKGPVYIDIDNGGDVTSFANKTHYYRRTNREIRIGRECHSACTMALGLPKTCVYPGSQVGFHQAYYNQDVSNRSEWGTSVLWKHYPQALRDEITGRGGLNKDLKIIYGYELIRLGIRDCSQPLTLTSKKLPPPRQQPADTWQERTFLGLSL